MTPPAIFSFPIKTLVLLMAMSAVAFACENQNGGHLEKFVQKANNFEVNENFEEKRRGYGELIKEDFSFFRNPVMHLMYAYLYLEYDKPVEALALLEIAAHYANNTNYCSARIVQDHIQGARLKALREIITGDDASKYFDQRVSGIRGKHIDQNLDEFEKISCEFKLRMRAANLIKAPSATEIRNCLKEK